ncbi:helix-turn-helix domain-containing protein [Stenotrophomonas sp. MMGLT7]|nr:helix-turn-helix domain-containing protein [Stenotrophomonas sp. MMGLT7]
MQDLMTIGEAARATGTRAETIRYYEKIGLLPAPPRSAGNYRGYAPQDVARLGFVRRARELGFSIDHVRELLELADRREHDCCRVDELTRQHVAAIGQKIADLTALDRELNALLASCRGGRVAECRILEALAPANLPAVPRQG